jgi:phosphoribosyl 1,2-cyclic phosphodiesterase
VKVKVWGARGSIPAPGPETTCYGGNTSCVEVTLSDGTVIVLDAGTGIRPLGLAHPAPERPVHVLLTHLHLDHIQGLMFYAPLFRAQSELHVWGPAAPEAPLRDRIARYISAPLAPVEVRELPCRLSFRETEATEWRIGPARVRAVAVTHRGPTLGYRIEDAGVSLCYIPDHEPALGASLRDDEDEWISGLDLACDADLLVHDCQYTDAEYPDHLGWGHSGLEDALAFGRRARARRLLLFHHDPLHSDDFLDAFAGEAAARWAAAGGSADGVELATERRELTLEPAPTAVPPAGRAAASDAR